MEQLSFEDALGSVCKCGCGKPVAIARVTDRLRGFVAGAPYSGYAPGHNPASGSRRGESLNYSAIHAYLLKHSPKTGICEECGQRAERTEHALIHGRDYSRDRDDYRELCVPCHRRYDRAGMPLSAEHKAAVVAGQQVRAAREAETGISTRARGAQNGLAKLTEDLVVCMREERAAGRGLMMLARRYRVDKATAQAIVTGATWAHVGGPLTPNGTRPTGRPRKLNDEQVLALYQRRQHGEKLTALAREVGVSHAVLIREFRELEAAGG